MIDLDKLRTEMLSAGGEDYTGLYEVIWSLNATYPAVGRAEKLRAAQAVVSQLLAEGRVGLYTTTWLSRQFEDVPAREAEALVHDPSVWSEPNEKPYYCYAAA
ncbi:MAG: hypothetical protein JWO05_1029 [Gemmatimonadetes bacterium]|nr:hypothetical protein [Gemmatimonadota bacterium]